MFKKPEQFPFWTVLATALATAIALYAVWWMHIEPLHGWLNPIFTPLTALGASFAQAIHIDGAIDYVTNAFQTNPIGTSVTILTAFTAIVGIIGKIRADNIKNATEQAANEQVNAMDNALQAKSAAYEEQLQTNLQLQEKVAMLEGNSQDGTISQLSNQVTSLRAQNEQLMQLNKDLNDQLTLGTRIIERDVIK